MNKKNITCQSDNARFIFLLGYLECLLETSQLLSQKKEILYLSSVLDLFFQHLPNNIYNLDYIKFDDFVSGAHSKEFIEIINKLVVLWKTAQEERISQKKVDFIKIKKELAFLLRLISVLKNKL